MRAAKDAAYKTLGFVLKELKRVIDEHIEDSQVSTQPKDVKEIPMVNNDNIEKSFSLMFPEDTIKTLKSAIDSARAVSKAKDTDIKIEESFKVRQDVTDLIDEITLNFDCEIKDGELISSNIGLFDAKNELEKKIADGLSNDQIDLFDSLVMKLSENLFTSLELKEMEFEKEITI